MALSKEAQASLARSLSAYIRATPARELPGDLRRWRSWRPQTIASRSQQIAARLDDEQLRARVLEWLDGKPKLLKKDAEVLRLACERNEGWEEQIADLTRPVQRKKTVTDPVEQLRERVSKEKEKTAAAKEQLRKAKEGARKAVEAEKKRAAERAEELAAVRAELARAKTRIKELESETAKARETADRQVRREKKTADKARADKDRLAGEARAVRKEAAELRRGMNVLERELRTALRSARTSPRGQAASGKRVAPGRRKVLSAPHGLFDDSPETLIAWLKDEKPRLLIDGYNVTKAQRGFGDLPLAGQRDRLLDEVARLVRKYGMPATIVFDGSDVGPGTRRKKSASVDVEYSKADETADDHLIARLQVLPPEPVVVVTNDRELQDRARADRATIATSDQLLAILR